MTPHSHISPDELAVLRAALAQAQEAQRVVTFVANHLFAKYGLVAGVDRIDNEGVIHRPVVQDPPAPAPPAEETDSQQ